MTHKAKSGIYEILNLENNKRYIGQSVNITSRWSQHRSSLRKGTHGNTYLQSSWNKYGEQAFVFRILELIDPNNKSLLNEREDYWMDYYESLKVGGGYNFQSAIQGTFNAEWHIQERERKQKRDQEKDHNYFSNRKYLKDIPQETKDRIINALLMYRKTHSISGNRTGTNKLTLVLTPHNSLEQERVLYLQLDPYKILTKEEYSDQPPQKGAVYQIKPDSNYVLREFKSVKDVLIEYPNLKRKSLEAVLSSNNNHQSTKGLIFIYKIDYNSDKIYRIKPKSPVILKIDLDNNVIETFPNVHSIIKKHPNLSLTTLQNIVSTNSPSIMYPFIYESNLNSETKLKTLTRFQPKKVKCINLTTNESIEYDSISECISYHPNLKKKGIEKVLYGKNKQHKGFIFERV